MIIVATWMPAPAGDNTEGLVEALGTLTTQPKTTAMEDLGTVEQSRLPSGTSKAHAKGKISKRSTYGGLIQMITSCQSHDETGKAFFTTEGWPRISTSTYPRCTWFERVHVPASSPDAGPSRGQGERNAERVEANGSDKPRRRSPASSVSDAPWSFALGARPTPRSRKHSRSANAT